MKNTVKEKINIKKIVESSTFMIFISLVGLMILLSWTMAPIMKKTHVNRVAKETRGIISKIPYSQLSSNGLDIDVEIKLKSMGASLTVIDTKSGDVVYDLYNGSKSFSEDEILILKNLLGSEKDKMIFNGTNDGSNKSDELFPITNRKDQISFIGLHDERFVVFQVPDVFDYYMSKVVQLMVLFVVVIASALVYNILLSDKLEANRFISEIQNQMNEYQSKNYHYKFDDKKLVKDYSNIYIPLNELGDELYKNEQENIAKQKDLEESLNKQLKIEKSLTDFIAGASHEMKTPLSVIRSYTQIMKDGYITEKEEIDKSLSVILNETDRMNLMFEELLEVSRRESGVYKLEFSDFNLRSFMDDIYEKYDKILEVRDDNKILEKNKIGDVILYADRLEMEKVITNYLTNAIKYSPNNSIISIKELDIGEYIQITVSNKSDPISDDDLFKIWNKFYKVDKSHSKIGDTNFSSGVGLSIVKTIAEGHNVDYGASHKDGITKFYINIKKRDS